MLKKMIKKLTLLDFIIVFIIIFAAVTFLTRFTRKKAEVYVHLIQQTFPGRDDPSASLFWATKSFKKGDSAYGTLGSKSAEVLEVDTLESGTSIDQPVYNLVKLKVFAVYDKRTKQYLLNDTPLIVGNTLSVDISNARLKGVIAYVGDTPNQNVGEIKNLEIEIKVERIEPEVAKTYNSEFTSYGYGGEEIFKIHSVNMKPSEYWAEGERGMWMKFQDPNLTDVFIKGSVKARCVDQTCFFNNSYPIKVGAGFWAESKNSIIDGSKSVILNVKE